MQYVWLAVSDSNDIIVRRGTLGGSSITWESDDIIALNGSGASDTYAYPYITLDSSNYLWVGARYYDGTNYVYKTVKSVNAANSTWTDAAFTWNDADQISDDQTNSNVYGNISSLGSLDMYAVFIIDNALEGCKWVNTATEWRDSNGASCAGGGGAAPQYIKKIEQQINIIDQEYSTSSETYVPTDNSLGIVKFDPGKYNGETLYFEAILKTDTNAYGRYRSSSISLPASAKEYTVRLKSQGPGSGCSAGEFEARAQLYNITDSSETATVENNDCVYYVTPAPVYIQAARLIVVQSDATAITDTQTQVEVGNNDTTSNTSYELLTDHKIYRWDDDRFSGTVSVYFEATLVGVSFDTGYAALSSSGNCASIVTGSEVSESTTTWSLERSGNIVSNLTDDTDYWVCVKCASGDGGGIANAKIIIDQTDSGGLTKTQIVHQYNNTPAIDSDDYTAKDFDNQFNASNFSGADFTAYFESTLLTSGGGTYYARLTDGTTAIANTELTGTNTQYVRKRGTNIWNDLPSSATNTDVELKNGNTPEQTTSSTSWLLIQAGDQQGPTNIDDGSDFGAMSGAGRQAVRTSEGVLYTFINDGGSCEMWKSFDGSSWEEQDSGDNPSCTSGVDPVAAIDSSNNLHILYQASGVSVEWNTFSTSSDSFGASPENAFSLSSETVYGMDMVIDSDNVPHAVVVKYAGVPDYSAVYYDNRVGGSWGIDADLDGLSGNLTNNHDRPSITINEDGIPEIVYMNIYDGDLTGGVGADNNPDAAAQWTLYDVDDAVNNADDQRGASIAVDQDGDTWIAYVDLDNDIALATHNDVSAWEVGWTINTDKTEAGYQPSIAINGKDVYVFYEGQDAGVADDIVYDLYDADADTPAWSGETPLHVGTYQDVKAKWAYLNNNYGSNRIDYLFSDNSDVYWSYLDLRRLPTNVDDATNFGELAGASGRQVIRDSSGNLFAVVVDDTNNDLEVWKSTDEGNSWAEQDSANSPQANGSPEIAAVAIDSSDNLHIAYVYLSDSVRYVDFSGSFGTPALILNYTGVATGDVNSVAIAVDSNNAPHAVAAGWLATPSGTEYDVRYRNKTGGSWQSEVSVEQVEATRVDIAINEDNIPEISYIHWDDDLTAGVGDDNNPAAGEWTLHDVDTNVNNTLGEEGTSIAIDSSGNTWIAYVDQNDTQLNEGDYIALAKHADASAWTTGWTTYTNHNLGYEPSIVIDGEDIYVFYEDEHDDIVYDTWDSNWVTTPLSAVNIDTASNFGEIPEAGRQVVRTSGGTLYAVLIDDANNDLEVWRSPDGGTWTEQDSSDSPVAGLDVAAVAVDSNDDLHIAYANNSSPKDVMYGKFTTSDNQHGTPETVVDLTDGFDSWTTPSIAVDSNDIPHISYFYNANLANDSVEYRNRVGGTPWGAATIESGASFLALWTDITINEDDIPEVAYTNTAGDKLTAAQGDDNDPDSDGQWTTYDVDADINTTSGQTGTSIGIDLYGNDWIAYVDSDSTVALAKHTGDTWSSNWSTVTSKTDVGYEPSIVVNNTDIFVFYEEDADDIAYDKYQSNIASPAWVGEEVLEVGTYQDVKAKWVSLNNNQGSIQIDYLFSSGSGGDVFWNKLLLPIWTAEAVLEEHASLQDVKGKWAYLENNGSDGSDYGGGGSGIPEIDYLYSDNTDVFYNRLSLGEGEGSQDAIGTGKSGVASNFSLSSDDANNLHLAWIDDSTPDHVQYKKYSGGSWDGSATQLDSASSNDNQYVSVSVDTSPSPDEIYVIYLRSGTAYYNKYSGSWGGETNTNWNEGDSPKHLTANYSGVGRVFAGWTVSTNAPYFVGSSYIIIPEKLLALLFLGLLFPRFWRRKIKG